MTNCVFKKNKISVAIAIVTLGLIAISLESEITSPANDLIQLLLTIGSFIALISLYLTYRTITSCNRKLIFLATQADAISQGNYFTHNLSQSNRKGAVNTLAIAINRMQTNIQQTIKRLEEQKFILDHHSIVSTTNTAGIITYANEKFSEISGYSNKELIGKNHRLISSGHHTTKFYTELWQTISNGNIWQGEICNKTKNGELYWVLSTIAPLFDNSGNIVQYTAIRTDITKIKQTEEILRRTQKMEAIGELTGGIAHDFNNLLGIIIGNLDLIQRKIGDDGKLQKQLNSAQHAALRGAEITRRLLNFSRQSEELHSPVKVTKIICDYEDFIRKSITASINLEMHVSEDIWLVDLNPGDFQDAIVNLSLNARDAMPLGGTLIFEARNMILDHNMVKDHADIKAGEYVEVMISDSGTGINKATISKIFDPFFTTKEEGKGTGLGLAMVFSFVKRCKGTIIVYSEEGIGTTFKMYLPRSQSITDQMITSIKTDKQLPKGNETVLIVDDEDELAAIAKSVLEELGYTTICASSGDEAQQILNNNNTVDIVFSDVVMPGTMNGFDLAVAIAETKPNLKVLLTSGFTGKMKHKHSVEPWSKTILIKPYRDIELAEAIRKKLDE
jgi:PAS domain S-box-containing protein